MNVSAVFAFFVFLGITNTARSLDKLTSVAKIITSSKDVKSTLENIDKSLEILTSIETHPDDDGPDISPLTLRPTVVEFLESFTQNGSVVLGNILDEDDTITNDTENFLKYLGSIPFPDDMLNVFYALNRIHSREIEAERQSLDVSEFNSSLPTMFVIPGYNMTARQSYFEIMHRGFNGLYTDTNRIQVNWFGVINESYFDMSVRAILVGLRTVTFIKELMNLTGIKPESINIVGFDLGAHAAGYVGKFIPNIRMITALDAAGQIFQFLPRNARLTYTDATFVYAIHTNGALSPDDGLGFLRPFAHQDFYPNGGSKQPMCTHLKDFKKVKQFQALITDIAFYKQKPEICNHWISFAYYVLGFQKGCLFSPRLCDSYDDFEKGKCSKSTVAQIGADAELIPSLKPESKFYFDYKKLKQKNC